MPYQMMPFESYPTYPVSAPVRQPVASPRPAPVPPRQPVVFRIDVPPPEAIGIVIAEPPVTVPPPEKIGIILDRP